MYNDESQEVLAEANQYRVVMSLQNVDRPVVAEQHRMTW